MKTVAKFAAIALIAAPSFATAGTYAKGSEVESDVFVDTTPVAGGSSGSLGGAGVAVGVGLLALLAVAASDGS